MIMTTLDRIPGRLDPIGAAAAWSLAPLTGGLAVAYAIVQSVMHAGEIIHPEMAAVAVGALCGAAVVLAIAAHPSIARLDRAAAIAVVATAVLAALLSAASTWGHNRLVQDDWGLVGVGLLIFGMLWLRPPLELLVMGACSAPIVGLTAAEQAGSLHIINTPWVYVVVAATPVLVFAAVAATCGAVISRFASEWSFTARAGMRVLGPEFRQFEEAELHRAQLAELRELTLPLLASVAARGRVTEGDIEAAARTAAWLRERALQQARTTWLDRLALETGMRDGRINDPARLALHLPAQERAVVSACLMELVRLGLIDPSSTAISVSRTPTAESSERARFELHIAGVTEWRRARRAIRPFFSILRSLSGDATSTKVGTTMTVRFGFEAA
ncbi:MAG: hypothetical protein ACTHON_14585 [Humibacter sp.]